MSCAGDIMFHIYFNGKFETDEASIVRYEGGEMHMLEAPTMSLFTSIESELTVNLYEQRIWYKLPFEDMSELKLLCNGEESFDRMCKSADWTRLIEVYMEHENVHDENVHDEANQEEVNHEEEEIRENETRQFTCEEEARVEAIVGECNDDEDDNNAYRNTPPQSDCEEEEINEGYERWVRGSGELRIRQLFESVSEFREAVLEYALKGGWNIQFTRWGKVKSEAVCGVEKGDNPCPWRIYCSYDEGTSQYMVKTFQEEHTCFKDGHCKILSDSHIARLFLNDVQNNPLYGSKVMQEQIQERYNLIASYDQCRKAKRKALDMIQAEYDEEFRRIKDYEQEIIDSNPGSTTEVITVDAGEGLQVFDRFYVCFAGLRRVWLSYCQPIFAIDGCFLKSSAKGQLLTAVGRDANNQIYPVAWAVVHSETAETWIWFLAKLKIDLELGDGTGMTLVSDRQKGLLKAVDQELPKIEHRMCARHIYGNLKKAHPKKAKMKSLFWAIVESHTQADYETSLAELRAYDVDVYESLMARNPRSCSRAFFKTTSKCEDALNNFSESYNSAIQKSRALPLVQMLETMRRQTMVRIDRKKKSLQHKGKFTHKVTKTIDLEDQVKKWCRTYPGPTGLFEVIENGTSYRVNMRVKSCSCRRWDLTGIPCRHALRVAMDKKSYKTDDMVSDCYLTTTWQNQSCDSIKPLNGMKFWSNTRDSTVQPPPRDDSKGRKKKPQKRIKGVNESPTKGKKVTCHGRVMHCHRCGASGHNSLKCRNPGVPLKPRPPTKPRAASKPRPPKKRRTQSSPHEVTLGFGEGPSQTQD